VTVTVGLIGTPSYFPHVRTGALCLFFFGGRGVRHLLRRSQDAWGGRREGGLTSCGSGDGLPDGVATWDAGGIGWDLSSGSNIVEGRVSVSMARMSASTNTSSHRRSDSKKSSLHIS
jgi:hypothetical protein